MVWCSNPSLKLSEIICICMHERKKQNNFILILELYIRLYVYKQLNAPPHFDINSIQDHTKDLFSRLKSTPRPHETSFGFHLCRWRDFETWVQMPTARKRPLTLGSFLITNRYHYGNRRALPFSFRLTSLFCLSLFVELTASDAVS